jgi:hypothetical protein
MKISELVKGNKARFSYYRDGNMYYDVVTPDERTLARFPIDMTNREDIGNATFNCEHKAIELMRYIRKSIEGETLQTVGL